MKLQVQKHIEDYHDGRFVFCRPNGYPYASRFIYDRIIRIINKAGLTKVEGPHILRHTHITMLTEAGVDLRTIMDRVGHDDSKTTIEIYTHVTDRMKEDAATKLKVSFGDILQGVNSGRNVTGM